jgi:hypothetical protein
LDKVYIVYSINVNVEMRGKGVVEKEKVSLKEEDLKDRLELKFLVHGIYYAEEEETLAVALWLKEKCDKEGITDVEEAVERFYKEAKEKLKEIVKARRKELLREWIEKTKANLELAYKKMSEKKLLVSEPVLEQTFYDILDKASEEAI